MVFQSRSRIILCFHYLYLKYVYECELGTINIRSEAVGATPTKADSKDDNLAFVAGATGKVGSRTVR